MKRKYCLFVLILIIGYIFWIDVIYVSAESNEVPILNDMIDECIENLDVQDLEGYLSNTIFSDKGIKERLIEYVKSGTTDCTSIFSQITDIFFKEIKELFKLASL